MLLTPAEASSNAVAHEPWTGHQPLAHSRACSTLQVQELIKEENSPNNHSAQRKKTLFQAQHSGLSISRGTSRCSSDNEPLPHHMHTLTVCIKINRYGEDWLDGLHHDGNGEIPEG